MTETRERLCHPGPTDNSIRYLHLAGPVGLGILSREIETVVEDPDSFDLRLAVASIGSYTLRYVATKPAVFRFPAQATEPASGGVSSRVGRAATPGTTGTSGTKSASDGTPDERSDLRSAIGRDAGDVRWIYVHRGRLAVSTTSVTFEVGEGESFIYNPREDLSIYVVVETSVIIVAESRSVREQTGYYFPDRVFRYPKSSVVSNAAAAFIGPLMSRQAFPLPPMDTVRICRSLDALMLELYIENPIAASDQASKLARTRSLIIGYICAAFADRRLGISWIAQHFGLSERAIHRSFEPTKISANALIHHIRLETAVAMLLDHRYVDYSIDDIALRSGFVGGADLRRWMKRIMDVSPSDLRASGAF